MIAFHSIEAARLSKQSMNDRESMSEDSTSNTQNRILVSEKKRKSQGVSTQLKIVQRHSGSESLGEHSIMQHMQHMGTRSI